MKRDALVVGINQYPFLKDNPKNSALHLQTPAADAEAIAHLLETRGDFAVHRLPAKQGVKEVDRKKLLKTADLQAAIRQLFCPHGNSIPDTALLFFAGHGLRRNQDGETEGFLASSEASPRKNLWGISLKWLRQVLQESRVQQQIIWLDCCHSGELLNFTESELGEYEKGRDRCLIVASRDFQVAYGDGEHGMLTNALLQSLDPANRPDGWVTNFTLVDRVRELLKAAPQHPVCTNTGGQIILTGKNGVLANICPYKGLAYFDWNEEDPKYFYGRTRLTKLLLEKVQSGNFLAVLGASGSGKSSVVRAGLLYQLQLGEAIPGSERWKIYPPFTPGDRPLQRLKEVVGVEAGQLEPLIKAAAAERVVLVVDQFEEVFTQCRDDGERQEFFKCLLETLERTENKLCLVLVMRSDFFGKCTEQEYSGLANKIQEHLVTVMPMNQQELEEAITKPAQRVDLEVERELITQMIADVEGSPGNLPLMQYTLTELWERKRENRLMISHYTQLGGVKQALEKQANKVYESFSPEEQQIAKWIFLSLTRLGEETEDTRKQVRKQDLISSTRSQTLVEKVIERLADAKLIVTRELENEGERVAVVDIAHEALIRHWSLLRSWLDKNREAVIRKQDIEDAAEAWRDKRKTSDYLLQGTRLAAAEDYVQRYADNVPLSGLAQEFVRKSIKHKQINRRNLFITVTAVILGLSGLAIWALIEGEDARIRADSASSRALFAADRKLEALVASLRGAKRLKEPLGAIGAKVDTRIQAVAALRQSVYGITELNRFEGHSSPVLDVSISRDGQLIASAGEDGTVKIWNNDGKLINTWSRSGNQGGSIWQRISSVIFTTDGQTIAFPDHQNIQLIDRNGKLLRTLEYQGEDPPLGGLGITSIVFSPDSKIIASSGSYFNGIRLQTLEGKLLATIPGHDQWTMSVVFSPNGQLIASSGDDGTVKLWTRDGRLLKTIQHTDIANTPTSEKRNVWSVSFSPDGNTIASSGEDSLVKLWKIDGTLLATFSGHKESVKSVCFSPNGQLIASASSDNTIKVWKIDGTLLTTIIGHSGSVNRIRFSPDGREIVSASDDGTIRLWSLQPADVLVLKGHTNSVTDVEFSSDGELIATASKDRTIKIWNNNGYLLNTLLGHSTTVSSVSFSPNGQMIASSEEWGKNFRLWKRDRTLLKVIRKNSENFEAIDKVQFSPDGKLIASSGYEAIDLWDYEGKIISTIKELDRNFLNPSFSPDGQIIASYSIPNTRGYAETAALKLWQINGKFITKLVGHKATFSKDNKLVATAGEDGVVRIFKNDGSLITSMIAHSKNVTDVSFSPNSQMLASASQDGTVKLWTRNGTLIETLSHLKPVNSLSFSPDGKTLATAVDDGTVILWNLDLDDLLARGCEWARGYLENNSNVAKADRNICQGVSSPKSSKANVHSEEK